ncbi:hypothetical protein AMJ44_03085 [candidate division WOR-1 bacterium DG_54_3]|uniref:Uncharacterized protein n=1 Tax=candidate division WOR-1 bacterium DG_54_3 TaxID=1703775 RepID=A0A0S7Y4K7_UNCSA|nr:MAG: hypothetical protein AMJ44_03085 [candidate division WOR-1 bacterium DG_54_3]
MSKKLRCWLMFFTVIFISLVIVQNISYGQEERKLHIAIVGSIENDDPQYNPFFVCSSKEVKLLLLEMAESPLKKEEIEARLSSSEPKIEDLLRVEIIRQEGDLYYLNFPLFTEKDEALIIKAAEKYSQLLAENILKKKNQIYELLDQYQPSGIRKDKLAFIAVGCLSLDFGALELLAKNNYIIHEPEKPGGNHYILNAEEVTEFSLKEMYWGGHTESIDGTMFMTFGDHDAETKRYAFPDMLWAMGSQFSFDVPEFYKKEFLILLNDQVNNMVEKIAEVLHILKRMPSIFEEIQKLSSLDREELEHFLDLLIKINYVTVEDKVYFLAVPAFSEADQEMLKEIQEIVNEEILSWAKSYYNRIKVDLKDISAVKNRVNYKETFNMLWHYFFGHTNKFLARSGFIYDTYQAPEKQKGYLPAVMFRKF